MEWLNYSYWETTDGTVLHPSDLSDTHLINTLKYIEHRVNELDGREVQWLIENSEIYNLLRAEAINRKLILVN